MQRAESVIAANYARLCSRIQDACGRGDRSPADVQFVAVTKTARPDWIKALLATGVRDLGESRPQQLLERAASFQEPIRWHLVGHLQRNKARKVLPVARWIHSVDSLPLLERLDELAGELGVKPRVLLEVNISGEEAKHGFRPDELAAHWSAVGSVAHVEIRGLMTMARFDPSPEAARPAFGGLR